MTAPNANIAPEPLAVGPRQAARLLSISERTLWTWTRAGRIPHAKLGKRVLYPLIELRQWLAEQARQATANVDNRTGTL